MTDTNDLEFGLKLPQWSSMAGPETWRRVARTVEASGFDWLGKGDHVVFLNDDRGWDVDAPTSDQFSVLSFLAAATDCIRLATNITVVPYRHPVHLAKLALTLDELSDGRFDLGVGVGWYDREYETLDVPFAERGSRTDEFLELFARVCEEPVVSFDGPHHSFTDVGFYPRPVQDGGPPVLVGGTASASVRRTAEYGDGWIGAESPAGTREMRDRIERAWDDFDREGEPAVAVYADANLGAADDPDRPLVGPLESVRDGVEAYADAGTTRLVLSVGGVETADELVDQIARFGDDVVTSF